MLVLFLIDCNFDVYKMCEVVAFPLRGRRALCVHYMFLILVELRRKLWDLPRLKTVISAQCLMDPNSVVVIHCINGITRSAVICFRFCFVFKGGAPLLLFTDFCFLSNSLYCWCY